MKDRLVEVSPKDWPNLCELYQSSESQKYIAYCTLEYYVRRLDKDPSVKYVKLYCLNGDFSDGTFAVTDHGDAHADTLNESHDNLLRLLVLLDYSKGYSFMSIRPEIRPTIITAMKRANAELDLDDETLLYYLPKEEALKLEAQPPDGIQLHSLDLNSDVEKIVTSWSFGHEIVGARNLLERQTAVDITVGAYKDDDTLISWVLRFPTGILLALQTDKEYLGRGYGSLVVKCISKKVATSGFDVYADVYERNNASRKLFEKLGFKAIDKVYFISNKYSLSSNGG